MYDAYSSDAHSTVDELIGRGRYKMKNRSDGVGQIFFSEFSWLKKTKQNKKKKNENPTFAESNAHVKTNACGSFETKYFFFSLTRITSFYKLNKHDTVRVMRSRRNQGSFFYIARTGFDVTS